MSKSQLSKTHFSIIQKKQKQNQCKNENKKVSIFEELPKWEAAFLTFEEKVNRLLEVLAVEIRGDPRRSTEIRGDPRSSRNAAAATASLPGLRGERLLRANQTMKRARRHFAWEKIFFLCVKEQTLSLEFLRLTAAYNATVKTARLCWRNPSSGFRSTSFLSYLLATNPRVFRHSFWQVIQHYRRSNGIVDEIQSELVVQLCEHDQIDRRNYVRSHGSGTVTISGLTIDDCHFENVDRSGTVVKQHTIAYHIVCFNRRIVRIAARCA